jgi:hypothetical protein
MSKCSKNVTKQNISTFVSSLSPSLSQNVIKMLDERKQKISTLALSLSLSQIFHILRQHPKTEKGKKQKQN